MSSPLHKKIAVVVVVAAVAAGTWWAVRAYSTRQKAQMAAELAKQEVSAVAVMEAKRGGIERSLVFTGSLEADNQAGVVSKIPGKVSRVRVAEGDFVRRGQLLVELERADLLAQRKQAQAGVQAAEARLKQAQTGEELQGAQTDTGLETAEAALYAAQARREQTRVNLSLTESQTGLGVEQAQEQLRQAQAALQIVETGAREQEVEIVRQAAQQAQANFDTAATNLERARKLLAEGAISQQQFDGARLQFDTAQAQYTSAVQQLNLIEEGARTEEVQIAQAQVNQAQVAVSLAQANRGQVQILEQQLHAAEQAVRQAEANLRLAQAGTARNVVSEQETEAARSALRQAQANLQYLDTQISYTYIRSPIAGYVVTRHVEPGEAALPGVPLINIVDNRQLYLRSGVAETRINKLSVGQGVVLRIDAFDEAEFAGTIRDIVPAADPESRTFDVKVEVPNLKGLLKAGMFGRATAVIEREVDVIVVPRTAVLQDDQGSYVLTMQGGVAQRQAVTRGLNNATDVVISEGLSENTKVIVRGQTLVRAGDPVKAETTE